MIEPVDALIAAWMRWEEAPRDANRANAKEDAIAELGLPRSLVHTTVAEQRRAGHSVPDAVALTVRDLTERRTAA